MNILIAAETYYPNINGAAYFAQRLVYHLTKKGHRILVIAPSQGFHDGFETHEGADVFRVRSVAVPYDKFRICLPLGIKNSLRKVIKDFQPDIIHLQCHFTIGKTVLNIGQESKIAIIGTNHFVPENILPYFHLPKRIDKFTATKLWKYFNKVYGRLSIITAPTQSAADVAHRNGFKKKILPISNGIDLEKFKPGEKNSDLRKKYGIPDRPVLIYVGRLDKEKNLDLLIRAFSRANRATDFHFVIVGKGQLRVELEKIVKREGVGNNVIFTGFVPDEELPEMYKLASCFGIASTAELQSIATMEAMAAGLPVVGVNAMALPELIHHGENGFLFETGDVCSAAKYLETIFTDELRRDSMSKKSLDIIKKHDIRNTVQQYEDLYLQAQNEMANHSRK